MELLQQRIGLRWRQVSSGTTNRSIFGAVVIVGGATAVVSLASIARDLVLAASFGTSDALDAFLIAASIPLFIVSVIAGSFGSALIPSFIQVREQEGHVAAQQLLSGIMALGLGLLVAASGLLALSSPILLPLLASGFGSEKLSLTQQLVYFLLPTIVLSGLATMWSAVLNAGERFALAAIAPAIVPLAAAGALVIGGVRGIEVLVFGMIGGTGLQLCFLRWGLAKQGVDLRPRYYGITPAMRQAIGQYVPVLVAVTLLGSTVLVNQAVAASLDPGSVATLGYGMKVVSLVIGLVAGALGTAVLPYSSKLVAAADWVQVRQTIRTYGRLTLLTTVPLAGLLVVFSEPIVKLVFQRGAFTSEDSSLVAHVQSLYALQIPFYVLSAFCGRLLSSLGDNQALLWSTTISFPVNAALAILLARVLGVAGIGLATSLMHVVAFCFLAAMLRRRLAIVTLQEKRDLALIDSKQSVPKPTGSV